MKLEELCAAVQEARYYNERFTRREYTSAFRTYTERFGPLYMAAVRETAEDWRSPCAKSWQSGCGTAGTPAGPRTSTTSPPMPGCRRASAM